MADNINEILREHVNTIPENDSTIIVLKGFPISMCDTSASVDIEKLLKSKVRYLKDLVFSGRRFILYEEFLALNMLIIEEYNNIYIIENNMFINYFPLYANISESILQGLLNHYDEEADEDAYIGRKEDNPSDIYINIEKIDDRVFVVYNNPLNLLKDEKIRIIKLIDTPNTPLQQQNLNDEKVESVAILKDISDEIEYVRFIKDLFKNPSEIYVVTENSKIDDIILNEKLRILKFAWQDWTEIYTCRISHVMKGKNENPEFKRILKQYWNAEKFRVFNIYDVDKLKDGVKEVTTISQADIISDIVTQVERSIEGKDARDIFVTAPTGAGKSALFQIPAIYFSENRDTEDQLVTLVISPLIGLMADQVKGLELKDYNFARTINSSIPPIIKENIIQEVKEHKCHILYLSPESLLSRSDLERIIGDRKLGMIIIDEAHIVTTWGKQFRPDYWYLGDHIQKLRNDMRRRGRSFVIATFTATAIYGGIENMYRETRDSLHMSSPITYLGYVKRDEDITIDIKKITQVEGQRNYLPDKFNNLVELIERSVRQDRKVLIYFPMVSVLENFYEYCLKKGITGSIARYHAKMKPSDRYENYELFKQGGKIVMLATKAFGMGIDIDDIQIVSHFAPTGNMCDYVQEIGRVARKENLHGYAEYRYLKNDMRYIKQLHGISMIKKRQLVKVIEKIYELYLYNNVNSEDILTRQRNSMLVDAESFSYIFNDDQQDENGAINKVKTAMLLIQKGYLMDWPYSPFRMRPVPMFKYAFFALPLNSQAELRVLYGNVIEQVTPDNREVCSMDLDAIWKKGFINKYSFPQFKYLLFSKSKEVNLLDKFKMNSALCVDVNFEDKFSESFSRVTTAVLNIFAKTDLEGRYRLQQELADELKDRLGCKLLEAESIIGTTIAAMDLYKREFSDSLITSLYALDYKGKGVPKYRFSSAIDDFFAWLRKGYQYIVGSTKGGKLYLVNNSDKDLCKEYTTILGLLECFNVLTFKMLGGSDSQLYIYVNQSKRLKEVIDNPSMYQNRLLDLIIKRHYLSVEMLSYMFESEFSSEEAWSMIEDYFLGKIPQKVIDIMRSNNQSK